jgi:hypothetical protein
MSVNGRRSRFVTMDQDVFDLPHGGDLASTGV